MIQSVHRLSVCNARPAGRFILVVPLSELLAVKNVSGLSVEGFFNLEYFSGVP